MSKMYLIGGSEEMCDLYICNSYEEAKKLMFDLCIVEDDGSNYYIEELNEIINVPENYKYHNFTTEDIFRNKWFYTECPECDSQQYGTYNDKKEYVCTQCETVYKESYGDCFYYYNLPHKSKVIDFNNLGIMEEK